MSLHLESRRALAVGRMTAAMRAVAIPAEKRALRVAIVQNGRIVEERLFRERSRVTGLVEDRLTLFDVKDGAWVLCLPNGATGHIVTREGRSDVGPLATRVRLDESARGKIALGGALVLFQLVVPPPRPSKPQLPLATKHGEIDWTLTILVAISFLIHFGVIGASFSDWMDPVVATESVVGVIDMTMKLPSSPMVEERMTPSNASTAPTPSESSNAGTRASTHTNARPSAEARAAALARDAEAMKMQLLGAFGGDPAIAGALNRSEVPIGNLEKSAHDAQGAEPAGSELHVAAGNPTITPGTNPLNALGNGHVTTSTVQAHDVDGPKVDTTIQIPEPGPPELGLEREMAKLRPSFRSCYVRKGLSVDPSMEGKVTIEIRVAPNGDVADVTKVDGQGLSAAVEQCIIERAHNATFPRIGGSGTRARVPIIFKQQR